mmetsp:Transcript_3197/g.4716  ORF Transcript_3197/g.4716 Transcript_3197/m.4716 type:complete len:579 (+) Transcript_3197:46-1782(+)
MSYSSTKNNSSKRIGNKARRRASIDDILYHIGEKTLDQIESKSSPTALSSVNQSPSPSTNENSNGNTVEQDIYYYYYYDDDTLDPKDDNISTLGSQNTNSNSLASIKSNLESDDEIKEYVPEESVADPPVSDTINNSDSPPPEPPNSETQAPSASIRKDDSDIEELIMHYQHTGSESDTVHTSGNAGISNTASFNPNKQTPLPSIVNDFIEAGYHYYGEDDIADTQQSFNNTASPITNQTVPSSNSEENAIEEEVFYYYYAEDDVTDILGSVDTGDTETPISNSQPSSPSIEEEIEEDEIEYYYYIGDNATDTLYNVNASDSAPLSADDYAPTSSMEDGSIEEIIYYYYSVDDDDTDVAQVNNLGNNEQAFAQPIYEKSCLGFLSEDETVSKHQFGFTFASEIYPGTNIIDTFSNGVLEHLSDKLLSCTNPDSVITESSKKRNGIFSIRFPSGAELKRVASCNPVHDLSANCEIYSASIALFSDRKITHDEQRSVMQTLMDYIENPRIPGESSAPISSKYLGPTIPYAQVHDELAEKIILAVSIPLLVIMLMLVGYSRRNDYTSRRRRRRRVSFDLKV